MSQRNLIIITKIILIYSFFYIGIKIFAIIKGAWLEANLILCLPFILLIAFGVYITRTGKYSWVYAIAGIVVIGMLRYFETDWAVAIQDAVS